MTVYIDNMNAQYRRMKMYHMIADTEEELAIMARKIGVNLKWWQYKGTHKSHFEICLSMKKKALELGAVEISFHEMGHILQDRKKANDPLRKPRLTLREEDDL